MHGSGIPAIFSCRESWTDRVGADLCVRPGADPSTLLRVVLSLPKDDASVGPYVRVTKPTAPSGTNRYCVGAVLPTHRVSSAIVIVRLSAGRWIGTIRCTSSFSRAMLSSRLVVNGLGGLGGVALAAPGL